MLAAKAKQTDSNVEIGVIACLGVVLSWMLLQTGFAQIYEILDAQRKYTVFDYPGKDENEGPVLLDYLYFFFTIGASFATSDVNVKHAHGRRVVLLHSILSFLQRLSSGSRFSSATGLCWLGRFAAKFGRSG